MLKLLIQQYSKGCGIEGCNCVNCVSSSVMNILDLNESAKRGIRVISSGSIYIYNIFNIEAYDELCSNLRSQI